MSYTWTRRYINHDPESTSGLIIRPAAEADEPALERVAQRDSGQVPPSPLLVAETGGALVAARSLATGEIVADPFRPTTDVLAVLELRALQLDGRAPLRSVSPNPHAVPMARPAL